LLAELFNFWLPFDFSVFYVSPERWVFVRFRRNHRNYFWEGFTWIERVFGSASIFLKVTEKFLFNKIQRQEKQKTVIELQLNSIRNMISKALTDNEISEAEFENILSQMTKRNETYRIYSSITRKILCGILIKNGARYTRIFSSARFIFIYFFLFHNLSAAS